jgi:hypothetical protein
VAGGGGEEKSGGEGQGGKRAVQGVKGSGREKAL